VCHGLSVGTEMENDDAMTSGANPWTVPVSTNLDELGCAMMQKKKDARSKSRVSGQKGQGGEGLSHGGSAEKGAGASGPEGGKRSKPEDDADYSPSLPTREKIAKVLR
jgi:hypothetical protein